MPRGVPGNDVLYIIQNDEIIEYFLFPLSSQSMIITDACWRVTDFLQTLLLYTESMDGPTSTVIDCNVSTAVCKEYTLDSTCDCNKDKVNDISSTETVSTSNSDTSSNSDISSSSSANTRATKKMQNIQSFLSKVHHPS